MLQQLLNVLYLTFVFDLSGFKKYQKKACGSQWWPLWHDSYDSLVTLQDSLHVVSEVLLHESVPCISELTVAVICICIQFWKCFAFCYRANVLSIFIFCPSPTQELLTIPSNNFGRQQPLAFSLSPTPQCHVTHSNYYFSVNLTIFIVTFQSVLANMGFDKICSHRLVLGNKGLILYDLLRGGWFVWLS